MYILDLPILASLSLPYEQSDGSFMLVVGDINIDRRERTFGAAKNAGDAAHCVSNKWPRGL